MYNLIQCNDNCSKSSSGLWQYHIDETIFSIDVHVAPTAAYSESFKFIDKFTTSNAAGVEDVEDNEKLFQQLKTGLHRSVIWNDYQLEHKNKINSARLFNIIFGPTIQGINEIFVLALLKARYQNENRISGFG